METSIIVFMCIEIEPVPNIKKIYEELNTRKDVKEIYEITGEYDLIIKVQLDNLQYLRALVQFIREKEGVKNVYSMITYHRVKP
jgi:DNA-binding Lrp family transcriptional regulator